VYAFRSFRSGKRSEEQQEMPFGGNGQGCFAVSRLWVQLKRTQRPTTGIESSPPQGMARVAQQAQDFSHDRIFGSESLSGIEKLRTVRPLGQGQPRSGGLRAEPR